MDLAYILYSICNWLCRIICIRDVGNWWSHCQISITFYIPPFFGFASFSAHEVSGISAARCVVCSIAGVLAFRNGGLLNKKLITIMGISIIVGTFIGSFGSNLLSEESINLVYGILALLAAIMMFIPKKDIDQIPFDQVKFNGPLAAGLAFVVGIGSGIVGAGGGFLLIPIMLLILRIPTRMTIASSLAIIFLSSIAGSIGKIATGQIDYLPAIIVIIAGLIAAPIGAGVSKKMNTKMLQRLLAILILATAMKVWFDILK